jgi:hypothetical protein
MIPLPPHDVAAPTTRVWVVTALLCLCACLTSGCIRAPDVVIVDRKTALEQQAGGAWPELTEELTQAGLRPGATPYTSGQLGAAVGGGEIQQLRDAWIGLHPDADRVDGLLTRSCIGEAANGTLVRTPDRCKGRVDEAEVVRIVEGGNRGRRQIWRYLKSLAPTRSDAEIRKAWRREHLLSVVCGGLVEDAPGAKGWGLKKCD